MVKKTKYNMAQINKIKIVMTNIEVFELSKLEMSTTINMIAFGHVISLVVSRKQKQYKKHLSNTGIKINMQPKNDKYFTKNTSKIELPLLYTTH